MARILLIDDDELVRQSLQSQLELDGHEVTLAEHGGIGLKKFLKDRFDLVITDILMPDVEGIETVKRLRQIDRSVPVIVMTGGASVSFRPEPTGELDYLKVAKILGATGTLRKPFTSQELRAMISECLG